MYIVRRIIAFRRQTFKKVASVESRMILNLSSVRLISMSEQVGEVNAITGWKLFCLRLFLNVGGPS
jgi:hypothetical protein